MATLTWIQAPVSRYPTLFDLVLAIEKKVSKARFRTIIEDREIVVCTPTDPKSLMTIVAANSEYVLTEQVEEQFASREYALNRIWERYPEATVTRTEQGVLEADDGDEVVATIT